MASSQRQILRSSLKHLRQEVGEKESRVSIKEFSKHRETVSLIHPPRSNKIYQFTRQPMKGTSRYSLLSPAVKPLISKSTRSSYESAMKLLASPTDRYTTDKVSLEPRPSFLALTQFVTSDGFPWLDKISLNVIQ